MPQQKNAESGAANKTVPRLAANWHDEEDESDYDDEDD